MMIISTGYSALSILALCDCLVGGGSGIYFLYESFVSLVCGVGLVWYRCNTVEKQSVVNAFFVDGEGIWHG